MTMTLAQEIENVRAKVAQMNHDEVLDAVNRFVRVRYADVPFEVLLGASVAEFEESRWTALSLLRARQKELADAERERWALEVAHVKARRLA